MTTPRTINVEPFSIHVAGEALDDLRTRIRATRWPDPAPDAAWLQGTDLAYLQALLRDWANAFDWRARERELNSFTHLRAELDAVVALLYGLSRAQAEHVFATFHRGWDYGDRLQQVLAHYDRWTETAE